MQYSRNDNSDDDVTSNNSSGSASDGGRPQMKQNNKKLQQSLRRLLLDTEEKNSGTSSKGDSESETNERVTFCESGSSNAFESRRSNSSERFHSHQSGSFSWADCDLEDFEFDDFDAMEPPSANVNVDEDGVPTLDEDDSAPMPASEPTGPYDEEKHSAGECKPCLYVSSKAGCRNGEACNFCHLPHRKQVKNRPCKATRMQCKKIAEMLETHVTDLDQRLEFSELLGARTPYTKLLLKGKNRPASSSEYDSSDLASSSDASSSHC